MIKLYNTLSGKKEILKPFGAAQAFGSETQARRGKKLRLFVCGPTVYDFSHLGHARTYVAFDMIAKYLRQKGYNVFYLQNITDIDDKIIKRAAEKNITPQKLAKNFEKEYLKDIKALKITGVSKYARATDYIKEIISQTERLLKKGFAYQIEDGIYYDIFKFKDYGKLSKRTAVGAESATSRIDESVAKKNKGDFCLWKFSKAGEPKWPFDSAQGGSAIRDGRPGWHIEDTAITEKFFGPQYDIHGGARDLIFPHHEAEIAQMEAISGKAPLVKHWLHTGFLTVNGQKMSKSLGNFITINDFANKHDLRVLRFFMLKTHYRSPVDYSEGAVLQAERELERIDEFVEKIQNPRQIQNTKYKIQPRRPRGSGLRPEASENTKYKILFEQAMDDDFNTPKAMAVIFEMMRQRDSLNAKDILEFLKQIDKFFNFIFWPKLKEKIPQTVLDLVKQREEYRKQNNWQKADEIREEIKNLGWTIEDTGEGPKIKRLQ